MKRCAESFLSAPFTENAASLSSEIVAAIESCFSPSLGRSSISNWEESARKAFYQKRILILLEIWASLFQVTSVEPTVDDRLLMESANQRIFDYTALKRLSGFRDASSSSPPANRGILSDLP